MGNRLYVMLERNFFIIYTNNRMTGETIVHIKEDNADITDDHTDGGHHYGLNAGS